MGKSRACLAGAGLVLVAVGTACLLYTADPTAWAQLAQEEDKPKDSPECLACLDEIHKTRANERDALTAEKEMCRNAERSCEDNCPETNEDCFKQCKMAEHKCKADSADRHADHLTLHGMIQDHHTCREYCKGLSTECEQCIEEVHATRAQARSALDREGEDCADAEDTCYARCDENDKQCRQMCQHGFRDCRDRSKERHRPHLTLHGMIEDHHKCKAICEGGFDDADYYDQYGDDE
mmetsp:Transcript_25933/g.86921  ORF Transcript_25933/g.86921 Transcript_25933/m.86921 type:complete len:237 (+) Transcript_25933:52-762(+)